MTMNINLAKAELTEDEQLYVDSRSWLARAREEYFASGGQPVEEIEEDEEEDFVPVEEWVKLRDTTKAEIASELAAREVEYDPKASKAELGQLLVETVRAEEPPSNLPE